MEKLKIIIPKDGEISKIIGDNNLEINVGKGISAFSPMDLFYSSLLARTASTLTSFFKKRDLDYSDLELEMEALWSEDDTTLVEMITNISLPSSFPEKYLKSVNNIIGQCTVKKTIVNPPKFTCNVEVKK